MVAWNDWLNKAMNMLIQDIRYALRMLAKSPSFTAIAIVTLALGIGASTALFSVINGVLLNPLPYPHPEQLVAVYGRAPGFDRGPIAYLNFVDWQRNAHSFSSMAMYHGEDYNLTDSSAGERVSGSMISAAFLHLLGAEPVFGRDFRVEDDQVGAAPVAILGGGFWKRKFGSSPEIVGKTITLNGSLFTIVGVVPAEFSFYGQDPDVYTPIGQWNDPSFRDRRIVFHSGMVGRLKSGVALPQAQAELENIAQNLAVTYPEADKGLGATLVAMKEDITGNVQPFLMALLCAVGFLLLIACANVANLLLARSISRGREFTVRAALGASPMRVIRQLLTESVLLAGLGGVLGVLIAFVGTKALLGMLPGTLPRASEISMDARVLFFTLGISLLAGIVFGLAPALKASRPNLQATMKEGGRGMSGGRHRLQGIFVAAEVAMALVLLVGAGLMVRTLAALWHVNPGYNPDHAVTFSVSMPVTPATSSEETRARLREFDRKMRDIPGVVDVSATVGTRPMIHPSTEAFWIDGKPKPTEINEMNQALFTFVEPGFQKAMGITLERGRFLSPQDDEHSPVVIVIDNTFARKYFPHEDPVGKDVNLAMFGVHAEVVGVVGHVRQWGLDADDPSAIEEQFYYPFLQIPEKLMPLMATAVSVVLRTQGDPAAMMDSVRHEVASFAPGDVIYKVQTLNEVISQSFAARRLTMILLGIFASLALVLSCVGIYGVISYLVSQQTQEIGVRMALGAQRGDVLRLVLGQGTKMALIGVGAGIALSFGVTRLMGHMLFGVTAYDPVTFGGVAVVLTTVAMVACYVPALRATRIDPVVALRHE
jgi:predicted permease